MAQPFPEGEVFFLRNALTRGSFTAENKEHFYSHMLVEFVYNKPFKMHSDNEADTAAHYLTPHPRSHLTTYASSNNYKYDNFSTMSVGCTTAMTTRTGLCVRTSGSPTKMMTM